MYSSRKNINRYHNRRKCRSTYLEINDDECHDNGGEKVAKVWCVLSVNSLLETVELVWLG
jgi:hypothetical protein